MARALRDDPRRTPKKAVPMAGRARCSLAGRPVYQHGLLCVCASHTSVRYCCSTDVLPPVHYCTVLDQPIDDAGIGAGLTTMMDDVCVCAGFYTWPSFCLVTDDDGPERSLFGLPILVMTLDDVMMRCTLPPPSTRLPWPACVLGGVCFCQNYQ